MASSCTPLTTDIEAGKKVLVPLTNSLYVGGTLSDPDHVIVDVGTGFYVEKVRETVSILLIHDGTCGLLKIC